MTDRCVSCGQQFSKDDKFCCSCGAELPVRSVHASPECRVCGEPLAPEDRFCGECGSEVGRQIPVSASTQVPRQRPTDVPRRKPTRTTRLPSDSTDQAPDSEVCSRRVRGPGHPNRWWPESTTGRVAFPMITAAAGVIGLFGSKGNVAAAGILAVAALAFMTFWRNVWISWAMPSAKRRKNPTNDLGETEGGVGSGRYQAVAGFMILLILLAIVRGCGKDIIRAIF